MEAALRGHVARLDEMLALNVELVRTDSGEQIWGHRYTTRFPSWASFPPMIAGEVGKALEA